MSTTTVYHKRSETEKIKIAKHPKLSINISILFEKRFIWGSTPASFLLGGH